MNSFRLVASLLILGIGCTGIVVACSSDEAPAKSTTGTTTVRVSAAAGGTVTDPSGKTSLVIPPGALDKDTDITLTLLAKSGGAVVDVSEFGPDGLTFLKPVALTIKADAALAPTGKSLAVGVNDGADFKAVEGSTFANGAATASIMHFSRYTVIVVDGKLVLQPPSTCTDARSTFAPCGGDPTGTWSFAEFCTAKQIDSAGGAGLCPENSVDIDYTINRDVIIDATTIRIAAGSSSIVATFNYFLGCFGRVPDSGTTYDAGVNDCATVQQEFYTKRNKAGTCVDKAGGYCACTETSQTTDEEELQTYKTSGSTLTVTKKDGKVETSEFCVKGDLLYSKQPDKDGQPGQIYVLKRK